MRTCGNATNATVAAALVSSLLDRPVPASTVIFGEVGLAGEVRAVGHMPARMKEAQKLGFDRAVLPAQRRRTNRPNKDAETGTQLQQHHVKRLSQLVEMFGETDARQ